MWARCGISGVVYDFEVYTRKNNTKKDNEIESILMGGNAVYDFEVYTGKNNTKKDNEIESILMGGNAVYCLT